MNRKEFLKTKEGAEWFRGKTKEMSRGSRAQLKKWILHPKPTKSELRRSKWYADIDSAIKDKGINKND